MQVKLLKSVIFWALFPFLIPQALWVRKTAPRFAEAQGEREGVVGKGETLRLLAIGDSIIAGVGASTLENALVGQTAQHLSEQQNSSIEWSALGKTGITSSGVLHTLVPQLPDTPPDFIIVSVGVNDLTSLSAVKTWQKNLEALLTALTNHAPNAVIGFAGMPPLRRFPLLPQPLRALFGLRGEILDQAAIEIIARYPNAAYVWLAFDAKAENFSADGFHPNEDSYAEFGRLMAEALTNKKKVDDLR